LVPSFDNRQSAIDNPTMSTLIHQRVEQARRGENPYVLERVRSGWVVIGDQQVTRGYCLLLPDPVVPTLNDLQPAERERFLLDMAAVGDAVLAVTHCTRINYEMLGNLEPALHAHVFPRYANEPAELRSRPIWFYDWNAAPRFDPQRDAPLVTDLRAALRLQGIVASA
jgi:diadenosine tetraphosphate (Ap4A) HIT family hydrolase